jgi:hypothetical protein
VEEARQYSAQSSTATVRAAEDGSRLLLRCDTVNVPIVSVQFMPKPAVLAGDPRTVTLTLDEGLADMTSWLFPGKGAYNGEPAEVYLIAEEIAKAKKLRIGFSRGRHVDRARICRPERRRDVPQGLRHLRACPMQCRR